LRVTEVLLHEQNDTDGVTRGRNKTRSCIATSRNGADSKKNCNRDVFVGVVSYILESSVNATLCQVS
jgi:hypothetical protein